ncbi:alcohol dehydrogenase catalytic domain-containing protein [Actinomyces sp. ICM47]|uniref:alcohol dehydrogenase catalytic domain-containing protein n=1 Tax=Actinomyces sp. ICM47 TaxID=936548 RepID=UPI0025BE84D1|nr:alcohol dehydrogenase catalytic domain-containing protein [Actinomyces sp. ICM47]
MDSMLAASLPSPGSLTLLRRPLPILGPRDVLLSVEATTLCGTDLRIVTGQKTHGVTPGVDLRPGIDAPAPGTQVGLAPEIACGYCAPCTAGRSNVCANMALFGTGVDGGLADVIRVPERARSTCPHSSPTSSPSPRWKPRSTPYARAPASRSLCAPDATNRPSASQAAPAGPRR